MELTVIILTHNEESRIRDCIQSAMQFASQILVLDEQSTDNTCSIARSLGARVIDVPADVKGFGPKRRFAVSKAATNLVLHLDSDERITTQLAAEIKDLAPKLHENTVLEIPRLTYLFGTPIRHCGWYPDFKRRLYDRRHTDFDEKLVHEDVPLPDDTKVIRLKNPLLHYSYPTLESFWRKQAVYAALWGENKARAGKTTSLAMIPLRAFFFFIRTYVFRKGFLDGRAGLWLSIANMGYEAAKYLSLYQCSRARGTESKDPD